MKTLRLFLALAALLATASASALSPPWYGLQRRLEHSVGANPQVSVSELSGGGDLYRVDIACHDLETARGLAFLLVPEHDFGGVRVVVTVLGPDGLPVGVDLGSLSSDPVTASRHLISDALRFNRYFEGFIAPCFLGHFCVEIEPEVIQYWNDNLGDPHGNDNFVAAEVFASVSRGSFFDGQVVAAFTTSPMPLRTPTRATRPARR